MPKTLIATALAALLIAGATSVPAQAKDPRKEHHDKEQEKEAKSYYKVQRKQAKQWAEYQRKQARVWNEGARVSLLVGRRTRRSRRTVR